MTMWFIPDFVEECLPKRNILSLWLPKTGALTKQMICSLFKKSRLNVLRRVFPSI